MNRANLWIFCTNDRGEGKEGQSVITGENGSQAVKSEVHGPLKYFPTYDTRKNFITYINAHSFFTRHRYRYCLAPKSYRSFWYFLHWHDYHILKDISVDLTPCGVCIILTVFVLILISTRCEFNIVDFKFIMLMYTNKY